jgi:hypothetical protein
MIIQGHPDILRGPRGLNGLHGFGSTPQPVQSDAYTRFLPENGGLGIDALYQEIRDFVSTHSDAEILQAMNASGVSTEDYVLALSQQSIPVSPAVAPPYVPNPADVQPIPSNYVYLPPASFIDDIKEPSVYASPAYVRFLPENGGMGIDALYQEIRDFINTPGRTQAEIEQAKSASGVSDADVANAFAQPIVDTKQDYTFEKFCPPGSMLVDGVCVGDPSTYGPPAKPSTQEIRDFVSNNSQADILAAMTRTGVTQSDIIRAFKEVDAALATGQSPAFTRYLPENGGLGLEALYKEINDYASTHSFYELLAQMQRSGVSMKDVDAANSYAFGQQQTAATQPTQPVQPVQPVQPDIAAEMARRAAEMAQIAAERAAEQAASQEKQRLEEENFFRLQRERRARLDAEAAAEQAAIAAKAAQAQQALKATLAARAATAAAATANAAAAQATTVAASTAATKATAAATAAAASAATAAAVAIAKTPGQSAAYTRFLPENGGKGIPALYKEISDFVDTHSNAEIQTAMTASGVSEVDVIKALQVFPNKVPTQPAKDTGLALPLVISAIAAYFVLG